MAVAVLLPGRRRLADLKTPSCLSSSNALTASETLSLMRLPKPCRTLRGAQRPAQAMQDLITDAYKGLIAVYSQSFHRRGTLS